MHTAWQDVKYAVRTLIRTPGFSAVAILTLALGIGANTAIFSVAHAVLLAPLPYPNASELVALHETLPARANSPARDTMPLAPPTTRDWAGASSFSNFAPYAEQQFILTGAGEPERLRGASVGWSFFDTIGMAPYTGRLLNRNDDGPERPRVAIIGHDLWRTRFGADTSLVGQAIELSGQRYTVVGIGQPGFAFPASSQVWVPLSLPEEEFADDQRLSFYLDTVARLKPGVTVDQAKTELTQIARQLAGRYPKQYDRRGANVAGLKESIVGDVRPALTLLMATVACVLLIACVNVANLLVGRAAAREGEIATRAALGASGSRLLRQLLTESLVLAAAGAAGGVLLALWARDVIVRLTPANVPRLADVSINTRVLGFALGLTIVTALAFGLAPAILSMRRALRDSIAAGRTGTTAGARGPWRSAMVVAQLALSLTLLTGAGLLAKTFWKLTSVAPGFDASNVMTMEIALPTAKYPEPSQRALFFERVLEILESHPQMTAAGGATNLPLSNTNMTFGFYRDDMVPGKEAPLIANVRGITSGYFRALGIPLIRGRSLSPADREGSAPVVVINEAMQRKFWRDQDPIGQRISITRGRAVIWREIVGVVGDVRHAGLGKEPAPEIYMPYAHDPFPFLRIAVRSQTNPETLAGAMRAAVWAVDPGQPVSRVRPMAEVVAASVASERFNAIMIGTFALLALTLAAVGLYGVIAYSVTLRLHEFGIRLALGADRRHILGLVLRQGLTLSVIGLALGLGLALLVTRAIETQLYQTSRTDPATLVLVASVLLAIALVASYLPGRRAARVDPMGALRE
jgi:putative ABC transport system permease protein